MNGFKNCFFYVVSCFLLIACVEIPQYQNADASTGGETSGEVSSSDAEASADSADAGSQDSSVTAEIAVEVTKPPVGSCVDQDKDNYCDNATAKDCNDLDSSINPAATEKCGDGKDNNCNGQIDEGCPATVPTPTANNTLTVKYPDSASRRLSWGVTTDKSSIPYVWNAKDWQTTDTLTADLGAIQVPASKCLYVRFNVDEPGQKWLCMGNSTASAQLNTAASLTLKVLDKTVTTAQTIVLGGGCSAIFVVPFDGATNCGL